jgi:hypothetical protein
MSLRTPSNSNLAVPGLTNSRSLSGQNQIAQWERPVDWLPIGTSTATQYIQILVAVFNNQDTNSISFITSGATTIDWGDGSSPENVASGVQANHNYAYANVSNLTSRGYRQAVITITPQAGQNITAFNYGTTTLYRQFMLDITLKVPNITVTANLALTQFSNTKPLLENITILSHGLTSFSALFQNCLVKAITISNTSAVTNFTSAFSNCINLLYGPVLDTSAATNFVSMFSGCSALQGIPFYNSSKVTSFSTMFLNCVSLRAVPLMDTSQSTSFTSFFNGCSALAAVPLFDVSKGTSVNSMFNGCSILRTLPPFNFASVNTATLFSAMFANCLRLESLPTVITTSATDTTSMFENNGIKGSITLDLRNISLATSMFRNSSFSTITLQNCSTIASIGAGNLFRDCSALVQVLGPWTATNITSFTNTFNGASSLSRCQITGTNATISFAYCSLGATELNEIFSGLSATGAGKTITITGNPGAATCSRSIATAKGWAVSG